MNLTEIQRPSDKKLFEEIDKDNNTGFLTEDLVKVVQAKHGPWAEMTGDQLEEHIRKLCGG